MSLEERILGQLPDDITNGGEEYYDGFAEAIQKAATLAAEADKLMREMAEALERAKKHSHEWERVEIAASNALWSYNNWKEQNQ